MGQARRRRPPRRARGPLRAAAAGLGAAMAAVPVAADALRVLPVGDSRVEGEAGVHARWRVPLWQALVARGCAVDFLGPFRSPPPNGPNGAGFDADHASAGGAGVRDALDALPGILADGPVPDVVIVAIGGNDLLAGARGPAVARRVGALVDVVRAAAPGAAILLEQIVPGDATAMTRRRTAAMTRFNAALGEVAAAADARGAPVLAVDMRPGWDPSAMLADAVHYSDAGARHVAARYMEAMTDDLGLC